MWRPQVRFFERQHRVVTYEAAGHYAGARSGATLDDLGQELQAFLAALGVERPHVVGISMGGMIAQSYAINYPEAPASLVLASTTSYYPEESRRQIRERAETVERDGMGSVLEPTMERWFTSAFREHEPGTVGWVRTMLAAADPQAYGDAARAVASVNFRDLLGGIRAPTLVVSAEHDASMPADAAVVLEDSIPMARRTALRHAAHLCSVEKASAFNQLVGEFLQSLAAPATLGSPGP
jgi:pimeloyl-ACP methyl ester carboxylesterase